MGLFSRRTPTLLNDAELADLVVALREEPRLLGVGRGRGVLAVATDHAFAVRRDDAWSAVGWHEIHSGAWDRDTSTLGWSLIDGSQDRVVLVEPGQLPQAFVDLVGRSIVVQHRLSMPQAGGNAIIAGRRALTPGSKITWIVQALGSTDLDDPAVRDFIVRETDRLKSEYEFTSEYEV